MLLGAKPKFDNSRKICDRSVRPLCRTKIARWSGVPPDLLFLVQVEGTLNERGKLRRSGALRT
jgi:hypothetical protein